MKSHFSLNCNGSLVRLDTPKIMGILNITPDSFYADSRSSLDNVVQRAEQMLAEGATFIDVGGASTNPFVAEPVSAQEEQDRVLPIIEKLIASIPDLLISIDTFHASVAKQAVEAGAAMINDVSGGNLDDKMFETVAKLKVPYVLMHSRGTFGTMKNLCQYDKLTLNVVQELQAKLFQLRALGVADVIIDAGFGFAKNTEQNFELLAQMQQFEVLNCPVLVGVSRKSMIWKTLNIRPDEALNGTTVLNTVAIQKGAKLLRVHDVRAAQEAIVLMQKLTNFEPYHYEL